MNLTLLILSIIVLIILIPIWILFKFARIGLDAELYERWLENVYHQITSRNDPWNNNSFPSRFAAEIKNKIKGGTSISSAIFDTMEEEAWISSDRTIQLLVGQQTERTRRKIADRVIRSPYYRATVDGLAQYLPEQASLEEEFFSRNK